MRVDLILQGLHARMQKKPFLLFQFDLNADAVENLDLDSNGGDRRSIDQSEDPQIVGTLDAEDSPWPAVGRWKVSSELRLHETQPDDRREEHDLPVEQARPWQVAPDQAKDALIDERRKRPNVVFIARHRPQLSRHTSAQYVKRHSSPLSVDQCRDAHQHASERTGPPSADHSKQHDRFKTDVAGVKAVLRNADQDAKH